MQVLQSMFSTSSVTTTDQGAIRRQPCHRQRRSRGEAQGKRAQHTRAQDKLICYLQQGDEGRTKLS